MKQSHYLGSVGFFKHLLLGANTLMLLSLLLTTVVLAVRVYGCQQSETPNGQAPDPLPDSGSTAFDIPSTDPPAPMPSLPEYARLYPDLYATPAEHSMVDEPKVCYLTFDDGPSARTTEILDILDRYGVKASFFVVGKEDEASKEWMRGIVESGHALGMHSYSHDYRQVYSSVESCLEDYDRLYRLIEDATGSRPQIIRFPGGSINGYNGTIYQQLIAEMVRRGFVYFDWNAATGDAVGTSQPGLQAKNALKECASLRRAVVLMHDSGREGVVEALPAIIEGYRDAGFTFAALTPEVVPVIFGYDQ